MTTLFRRFRHYHYTILINQNQMSCGHLVKIAIYKLFRKTPQNLVSENKSSKDLIYAIGEIILLANGLFIQFEINNLNQ